MVKRPRPQAPRIIAGTWKGRRLPCPPGTATRPLLDRIKQSLFDWLGQRLDGWQIADCCAGSGSFAFEAASRGARAVYACEISPPALTCLRSSYEALGRPTNLHLEARSFSAVLPELEDLDLVFCDPPFPWFHEQPAQISSMLALAAAACTAEGWILLRGEQGQTPPTLPAHWQVVEERSYGRSWILRLQQTQS